MLADMWASSPEGLESTPGTPVGEPGRRQSPCDGRPCRVHSGTKTWAPVRGHPAVGGRDSSWPPRAHSRGEPRVGPPGPTHVGSQGRAQIPPSCLVCVAVSAVWHDRPMHRDVQKKQCKKVSDKCHAFYLKDTST